MSWWTEDLPEMFSVTQVKTPGELASFNAVLQQTWGDLFARYLEDDTTKTTFSTFAHRVTVQAMGDDDVLLLVFANSGAPVATLRLVASAAALPIEDDLGLSLGCLRKTGLRLVEVDKLAVIESVAHNGGVLRELFAWVGRFCLDNRVDILVCQALEHLVPMYTRLGFEPFCGSEPIRDRCLALPCLPMQMNVCEAGAKLQKVLNNQGVRGQTPGSKRDTA